MIKLAPQRGLFVARHRVSMVKLLHVFETIPISVMKIRDLKMEPELIDLLQKIYDGQIDFHADSDDLDALKEFQPTAKALLYLKKSGYMEV